MVESGPYIEYCCEVYVRQDYVVACVLLGLLAIIVGDLIGSLILDLIAWHKKKSRDRSRLK